MVEKDMIISLIAGRHIEGSFEGIVFDSFQNSKELEGRLSEGFKDVAAVILDNDSFGNLNLRKSLEENGLPYILHNSSNNPGESLIEGTGAVGYINKPAMAEDYRSAIEEVIGNYQEA